MRTTMDLPEDLLRGRTGSYHSSPRWEAVMVRSSITIQDPPFLLGQAFPLHSPCNRFAFVGSVTLVISASRNERRVTVRQSRTRNGHGDRSSYIGKLSSLKSRYH
jgi:hypothetical protein